MCTYTPPLFFGGKDFLPIQVPTEHLVELPVLDSMFSLVYFTHNTVHPEGDQSRVFIGRTDTEAETPILWPPDMKN